MRNIDLNKSILEKETEPQPPQEEKAPSSFTWKPQSMALRKKGRRVALEAIVADPKEPLNENVKPWDWDAACTQIHYLQNTKIVRNTLVHGAGFGAALGAVMGDGSVVDRVASGGLKGAILAGGYLLFSAAIAAWYVRNVRNEPRSERNRVAAVAYASPVTKRMLDIDGKIAVYENPLKPVVTYAPIGAAIVAAGAGIANIFGLDVDYGFAAALGASFGVREAYVSAATGRLWAKRLEQS